MILTIKKLIKKYKISNSIIIIIYFIHWV